MRRPNNLTRGVGFHENTKAVAKHSAGIPVFGRRPSRQGSGLANMVFWVCEPSEPNVSKSFLRWKLMDFWCNYNININSILIF